MAQTENGTNGERMMTAFPLTSTGLATCFTNAVWWPYPSCHDPLASDVRSYRRAFPANPLTFISLYLSFYEILHVHNLKGPGGIVYLGIFFCKVTLSMANCKACPVNNLPLGNRCLKSILHDSLASFYHSKSFLSRKIFPTHCQKALNKGK